MTPAQLQTYLTSIVHHDIKLSVMVWGPPGIGKSSIVAELAVERGLSFVDLRLSQLAPTDLRGLPVPENGVSRWYPPEFLPRDGNGIFFLDELNMAPPAVQGIAQQLILDRKVGSYELPPGWFVWAAGNRKEDRASVFDMPAPLANRFLHVEVTPDFDSFRTYGIQRGLHEQVLAFLSFRPTLLHKLDPQRPAWPSPRTWEMASRLHGAGLDVAAAVGEGAAAELAAFVGIYERLANLDDVLRGQGKNVHFPTEPSMRYAISVALSLRAKTAEEALAAFHWMVERGQPEWVQLLVSTLFIQMRARGQMGTLVTCIRSDPTLEAFLADFRDLVSG